MNLVYRTVIRSGYLAFLLSAAACAPTVCPQPAQLTSGEVQKHDGDHATEALRAEVRRLEKERDSARQWATDEQRRQADGHRLREQRRELQAASWQSLDALDADIREVRRRLDLWTLRDRKTAYEILGDVEDKRMKIEGDIRKIPGTSEASLPALRTELHADLERAQESVHNVLHPKEDAAKRK